ncbi:hypothetical protein [Streptomyces poriticola]
MTGRLDALAAKAHETALEPVRIDVERVDDDVHCTGEVAALL